LFALEAHNAYQTSTDTDKKQLLQMKVGGIALSSLVGVAAVFAAKFEQVSSDWSCLGNFTKETINLWFPLALLHHIAALAATSYSYKGLYFLKQLPQYRKKLEAHMKNIPPSERNEIETVKLRSEPFRTEIGEMCVCFWPISDKTKSDILDAGTLVPLRVLALLVDVKRHRRPPNGKLVGVQLVGMYRNEMLAVAFRTKGRSGDKMDEKRSDQEKRASETEEEL
uniref:G_PROTEIN_RECEP_F2_4 domain-containing protein n=1 Tax=Heligmosomoides polygyrus TaxID=6339 RepID=A0A183GEB5_HELPZ